MSKKLNDILTSLNIPYRLISKDDNNSDPVIEGISYNSRTIKPGELFCCLVGESYDAHNYVNDAIKNGARAILAEKELDCLTVPTILVDKTSIAMSIISNYFYDYPSSKLRLIGITGTNGKTTVTHILEKIMENNSKNCALIGTLGNRLNSNESYLDSNHTTPQAPELQKFLHNLVNQGFEYAAMEVSSHSLELHRVLGCEFSVALLTNITQDHLDFHVTMNNYANAKLKLFKMLINSKSSNKTAIINLDDKMSDFFINNIKGNVSILTYGIFSNSDIKAVDINYSSTGTEFKCLSPYGNFNVSLKLRGQFSVYNALSAISVALAENVPIDIITKTLYEIENVAGRFESVNINPLIIVDYAHTPDGLSNILLTARKLVPPEGELFTVFGCGGDRDPTKRPKMAKIAEQLSDKVFITSDNPRTEDPQQIITDILTGIKSLNGHVKVEINRFEAIKMAIKHAKKNDVIVIAGKGHENYQILADKTIHFDDREVVREIINEHKV